MKSVIRSSMLRGSRTNVGKVTLDKSIPTLCDQSALVRNCAVLCGCRRAYWTQPGIIRLSRGVRRRGSLNGAYSSDETLTSRRASSVSAESCHMCSPSLTSTECSTEINMVGINLTYSPVGRKATSLAFTAHSTLHGYTRTYLNCEIKLLIIEPSSSSLNHDSSSVSPC